MVLSSFGHKLVSLAHQEFSKGNCIGLDLFSIGLEPRCHGLLQGNSKGTNLVGLGPFLKVILSSKSETLLGWFRTLPVEDHTSPRTSQTCG